MSFKKIVIQNKERVLNSTTRDEFKKMYDDIFKKEGMGKFANDLFTLILINSINIDMDVFNHMMKIKSDELINVFVIKDFIAKKGNNKIVKKSYENGLDLIAYGEGISLTSAIMNGNFEIVDYANEINHKCLESDRSVMIFITMYPEIYKKIYYKTDKRLEAEKTLKSLVEKIKDKSNISKLCSEIRKQTKFYNISNEIENNLVKCIELTNMNSSIGGYEERRFNKRKI